MDSDTERKHSEVDAYWRRRVYVLAGGIAVIGLMAWACSDSGDKKSTAQLRNAAVTMSPAPAPAVVTPGPTTVTVTATPTAAPTVTVPARRRSGDRCDDRDVVADVVPWKGMYPGKEHPQFRLTVVNTAPRACTFDVGAKALQIHILSGADRIWSSAQCGGGPASRLQLLPRGVPYIATIDWDRRRCGGAHARPGTYVIYAKEGGVRTKREVFHLR